MGRSKGRVLEESCGESITVATCCPRCAGATAAFEGLGKPVAGVPGRTRAVDDG